MQQGQKSGLRNQRDLARWICREIKARKLRGTTMAIPGSVDGSLLGRPVTLRLTFRYKGPIPVDGIMIHIDGTMYAKNAKTQIWDVIPVGGNATCNIVVKRGRKKNNEDAFLPSHAFRGTGHDDALNALPVDLGNVCIYNIRLSHYNNQSDYRLSVAHSIAPDYQAYRDTSSEWYDAQKALGGLPYSFADMEPHTDRADERYALRSAFREVGNSGYRVHYQFLNPAFIASMRFMYGGLKEGDGNIWNGIWPIPIKISDEIGCKTATDKVIALYDASRQARQRIHDRENAMDDGDEEESESVVPMETGDDNNDMDPDIAIANAFPEDGSPVLKWYVVMRNHPIAWAMQDMFDNQRRDYGITSAELRVHPVKGSRIPAAESEERYYTEKVVNGCVTGVPDWAAFVYCHILPDVQLKTLLGYNHKTFQNRIDLRDIRHVGFVIGPYRRQQCHVYNTCDDGTEEPVFDTESGDHITKPLENCDIEFDVNMRYMVWPAMPDDISITPQLHADFPSLQEWVSSGLGSFDTSTLEAYQKHYEQHGRRK